MSLFGGRRKDGEEDLGTGAGTGAGDPPGAPRATDWGAVLPAKTGVAGTGGSMANIGKSISIKGDLSGNEDLIIDGRVEGKIELPTNQLTVGPDGDVAAEVHAKSVVIIGKVEGNVHATERVEIQATGSVQGDVRAPRLAVEEGAVLNGSVETGAKKPAAATAPSPLPRPAAPSGEKSAASGS